MHAARFAGVARTRAERLRVGWVLACACTAIATACGDNELGIQRRRPNHAPETFLSSGPPDSTSATDYRVHFYWSGRDVDGSIDHYDFIMVDHPAARGSMAGDDSASTVMVSVPRVIDPRWTHTNSTDSVFVTRADTLRRDPRPGQDEDPGDVLREPFERWHTFFVRAVDHEGLPDSTPDYRSFNAVNFAPTVRLKEPVRPGRTFIGPPVIVLGWDGVDPQGDDNTVDPVASRWVLIPSATEGLNEYTSWPDSLYQLPTRFEWSPWRAWGARDSSGVEVVLRGLLRVGEVLDPPSGFYIFAVQAIDEAGAITPVFDHQTPNRNNAVLIRVDGSVGPTLVLSERFMGSHQFRGEARPVHLDVAAGQRVAFHWRGDASAYGGRIAGYRFGWNLRNVDDDPGWSSWSATQLDAPVRTFTGGTHRFYLQVRDNAESVTSVQFVLTVHRVTRERDVLWVDDGAEIIQGDGREVLEDERWIGVLSRLADEHSFAFFPEVDVYDVSQKRNLPPPIDLVFRYKCIVWNVVPGNQTTGLAEIALFRDPFVSRHLLTAARFNYLDVFIENGGNLWISGWLPAFDLWPDEERSHEEHTDPVNVTNWDDPLEPHPLKDSAGVHSLVYKMGVELFESGSGIGTTRPGHAHFCRGLRRARGVDPQSFVSSTDLAHHHEIRVPTADIESPSVSGRTYSTTFGDVLEGEVSALHQHTVHASHDELLALLRGATVHLDASAWEDGSSSHSSHAHEFFVRDQFGLWGAPLLQTGASWSPGGVIGRPNVEIYNMPFGLMTENPPLSPSRTRTVPVYEYVSGVPSDPGTGPFYPYTADRQPVLLLTRRNTSDTLFSRAICGFDPYLLAPDSHERLARFLLVRHFGLGTLAP